MGIHVFCCPQPHLKRCPSGGYCSSFSRVRNFFALKPSRSPETSEQCFFTDSHMREEGFCSSRLSRCFVQGVEFRCRKRRGFHWCYSILPSACSTRRLLQLEEIFVVVFSLFTLRNPHILPLRCHTSTRPLSCHLTWIKTIEICVDTCCSSGWICDGARVAVHVQGDREHLESSHSKNLSS